jgi:hypothetical protein
MEARKLKRMQVNAKENKTMQVDMEYTHIEIV